MTDDGHEPRDFETEIPSSHHIKEDFRQLKVASRALKERADELKSKSDRLVQESSCLLGTPPLTRRDP